jgi:hypothetical protein
VRTLRYILFLFSILAGLTVGLYYAWQINPGVYTNTTPDRLRADYKADYCLMVAEIYQKDQSVTLATSRLVILENIAPLRLVQQAIVTAKELQYNAFDVQTLGQLAQALMASNPDGGTQP